MANLPPPILRYKVKPESMLVLPPFQAGICSSRNKHGPMAGPGKAARNGIASVTFLATAHRL
ncbi:MAG: hypothetical protein ACKV22_17365 [Bryobacteraceae bacterium]